VVLAAAGSGKTSWIVRAVAATRGTRVLVTTFTLLNHERVVRKLWSDLGGIPKGMCVTPWLSFLLHDLVRPYQNHVTRAPRISGVNLVSGQSTRGVTKSEDRYWFDSRGAIYTDKISEFAIRCDDVSGGAVVNRLVRLYDHVYVDEVQDLAGYDLDLVERLLNRGLCITMVGDPRQATFSTNQAARNSKYRGEAIAEKFEQWARRGLCAIERQNHSHRCGPAICRLADEVYPAYGSTESRNGRRTSHDGVVAVQSSDVAEYMRCHSPQVLRYDKNAESFGREALNFGNSKGLEFERVLIVPTGPIRKWLTSGDRSAVEKSRAKLYVAITRAEQSVAFVHDGKLGLGDLVVRWTPPGSGGSPRFFS
jgi:DNA helicase-2/ATP-dependent DNA helicase PcrA